MKASNAAAQAFQSKIADVILPTIRKNGFYATPEKIEEIVRNPEQFIEHLITAYQRVKTERDELKGQVNALKPKADYCEKILQSPEALNVTVIAKDYGMSAVMFNQLLYSLRIQYPSQKMWVYANALDTKRAHVPLQQAEKKRDSSANRARRADENIVRRRGMTFGQKLRRLRKERGWYQWQLAALAGITRPTLSQLEHDLHKPYDKTLDALMKTLGVNQEKFFAEDK